MNSSKKRMKNKVHPSAGPAKKKKLQISNGAKSKVDATMTYESFARPLQHVKEEPVSVTKPKKPQGSDMGPLSTNGSVLDGKELFAWLIHPITVKEFMSLYWEKKPLLCKRKQSDYYFHLISVKRIEQMLKDNYIEYEKNIDVTSYQNDERSTLELNGRVMPQPLWEHYEEGCSIRMKNPQTYIKEIHAMNATMQEYFHSFVGTNFYLTPPNSQGFAPHFDDIEAFVLQIEGKKRWRLYPTREGKPEEELARVSSRNFKQNEIGKPIMDVVLEPGDLCYFPRGTIHQACTVPGSHSLHVTLSVYQKNCWADLLEKILPQSLELAVNNCKELREGLPLNIWHHLGEIHKDQDTVYRQMYIKKVKELMGKLKDFLPVDSAVDALATQFQHSALPPVLTPKEQTQTTFGLKYQMKEDGTFSSLLDHLSADTKIRLLRANIVRFVFEGGNYLLYYYGDNSMVYQEREPNYVEIAPEMAAGIVKLINSYPNFVKAGSLIDDDVDLSTDLVLDLFGRGLLMTKSPVGTDKVDCNK